MQTKHDRLAIQLSLAYLQSQVCGMMGIHFAAIHTALMFNHSQCVFEFD